MVDYWLTVGRDGKKYYFRRSGGTTKRVDQQKYNLAMRRDGGYYVDWYGNNDINYYNTKRGQRVSMSARDFNTMVDYTPNLYMAVRRINRDIDAARNFPNVYSFTNPYLYPYTIPIATAPSTGVTAKSYSVPSVDDICKIDLQAVNDPGNLSDKCPPSGSCDKVIVEYNTGGDKTQFDERVKIIRALATAGVARPVIKSTWCDTSNTGKIVHPKVDKIFTDKISEADDAAKNELYSTAQRLLTSAHEKAKYCLGSDISAGNIGFIGKNMYLLTVANAHPYDNDLSHRTADSAKLLGMVAP